jgi:hypothetical protein
MRSGSHSMKADRSPFSPAFGRADSIEGDAGGQSGAMKNPADVNRRGERRNRRNQRRY